MKKDNPRPMRNALIIVENLPLPLDRRVWQEANTLKDAGYGVSIICPTGKGYEKRYEQINGIHIYRHPLPCEASGAKGYLLEYGAALWWEWRLALKILSKHGFDVIQACNPPDLIFLVGVFFKLFFRKKFVFDHHDISPEVYLAKFSGKKDFFYKLLVLFERLTYMAADFSIATNESFKKNAILRDKMNPDRIEVVRSGPNLELLKKVPPEPKWKNNREYLVGYLGVMGDQEGIDDLLKALRILIFDRGREDVQCVLVGGGTSLEPLKKMAKELNLDEHVTFTGFLTGKAMLEVLCTCDVCVSPDRVNEMNDRSTMNKIMEYMALGKPIVQYRLTENEFSAREASLYAKSNDVADFADKIEYLLDHPEERKKMGEFGYNRVKNELHWGVEAPKYLSVYERLFKGE